jgi:uncharacterized protein (DUF1684 family)
LTEAGRGEARKAITAATWLASKSVRVRLRPAIRRSIPAGSTPAAAATYAENGALSREVTANRTLQLAPPGPDGRLVLDFNRATNLPCAYTDLATCPLPPPENRLPVAIEAGEKIPDERR